MKSWKIEDKLPRCKERNLMAAMLMNAVNQLTLPIQVEQLRNKRLKPMPVLDFSMAVRWFESDKDEFFTDYIYCCKALGIDANKGREFLKKIIHERAVTTKMLCLHPRAKQYNADMVSKVKYNHPGATKPRENRQNKSVAKITGLYYMPSLMDMVKFFAPPQPEIQQEEVVDDGMYILGSIEAILRTA
jgi:hypothetical protein